MENSLPRVWVTGMWGFEPEKTGYVGFTKEGPRSKYIRECLTGDLMMIIGQRGDYSVERDVGRVLGLVELDAVEIFDTARMSEETHREKIARGWKERWRYAMPIRRAWKTSRAVKAKHVAPFTCSHSNARAIGATTLLLQPDEVERLMRFPIRKTAVFGEPGWLPDEEAAPELPAITAVSHGPPPSFGTSTHITEDGETKLYIMEMLGALPAVFPLIDHRVHRVLKIGRSNDEKRRNTEMNNGFPPGCELGWKIRNVQVFSSAEEAHYAEQELLKKLEKRGYAIGKEFAVVPEREISSLLASVSGKSAFLIRT